MNARASCLHYTVMLALNKRTIFLNLILLWAIILGVLSLRLNITPDHQDAGVSGAVFRVVCRADEPLTHCHFRWRDIYNNDGPLMDLSEGPETPPATNYSYTGTGLNQGECGIALNRPTGVQRWIVGCRVRTKTSGWHFAHMSLFAHSKGATSVTTSTRSVTVRQGGNVTLSCKAANRLLGCIFRLPDGSMSTNLTSNLGSGSCSATLSGITDSVNGFAWCRAWRDGYDEWRAFALTVASPPSVPVLEVSTATYTAGDVLTVTCTVTRALPSANMTWYLGGKVLRQDHVNEAWNKPWLWPFELRTIRQTLRRRLEAGDDGRDIVCGVKQINDKLPDVRSTYTIQLYRAPSAPTVELSPPSGQLKEGDILSAVCTVRGGYPRPQLTWFLGSANLTTRSANLTDGMLIDTVTKLLVGEDDGKELRCVVHHPSYTHPVEQTVKILVEHRPQISSSQREQLRFKVGSAGVAVVKFRANPKPDIYWMVDQVTLEEGFSDSTGRLEAAILTNNDNDPSEWIAQLFVNNVTLADLERSFFLNARNKLGDEFFRAGNFGTTEPAAYMLTPPSLTLSPRNADYPAGSTITASCTVQRNRPVPAIKWALANENVTEGVNRPILSQFNQGIYTIVQSMLVRLKEEDDGNQVTCIVGSLHVLQNISVVYPPKKLAPVIEQSLEVGKPGELSVELSANPQPGVRWEFGTNTIQEDESDSSGRFRAARVLATTRGKWAVKLFVSNVTLQDIGSVFVLSAWNKAGSMTYHLLLTRQHPTESTTSAYDMTTSDDLSTAEAASYIDEIEVKPTYSSQTESSIPGQINGLGAKFTLHTNDLSYRYLAIANTIAILVVVSLATFLYIRLLRRLSHTSREFDMDRAPIYMDNIYYDQMNGTSGQCALNSDQGTMGCG